MENYIKEIESFMKNYNKEIISHIERNIILDEILTQYEKQELFSLIEEKIIEFIY